MNNEFKDFMNSYEKVPETLNQETLKLAQLSLSPRDLLIKFFGLNVLGALGTLAICPQYGFGPIVTIQSVNSIIHSGPIVCGIFCSTIFFLGGNLLSYFFLKPIERNWVTRHEYAMIIPYISFLFMLGMGLKNIAPGHLHNDTLTFYLSWIMTAFFVSILFFKVFRSVKNGHPTRT